MSTLLSSTVAPPPPTPPATRYHMRGTQPSNQRKGAKKMPTASVSHRVLKPPPNPRTGVRPARRRPLRSHVDCTGLLLSCRGLLPSAASRVQRTIKSSKNTVRTGVFVGHAVRYLIHAVPQPGTHLIRSQKNYGPHGRTHWTRQGGGGGTVVLVVNRASPPPHGPVWGRFRTARAQRQLLR